MQQVSTEPHSYRSADLLEALLSFYTCSTPGPAPVHGLGPLRPLQRTSSPKGTRGMSVSHQH